MNREVLITLIACVVVFSGITVLAFETMNTDQGTTTGKYPEIRTIEIVRAPEVVKTPQTDDFSIESLVKTPKTLITKLDDKTSILKTITALQIPEDNKFPWGSIKGKISNPAAGHPVIIKFYKSLDDIPVHVAQVDLMDNDTFEYKFRLFSIDEGITTHIFKGDYYIEIFKTINSQ